MIPYSTKMWDILPHIFLTQDIEWDSSVLVSTKAEYN